jgi:DNA-binding PadR family transcriptional regulator
MKRDIELVKQILSNIESNDTNNPIFDIELKDYKPQRVYYHCHLLIDAGLIEGYVDRSIGGTMRINRIYGLTWEGHEFLDAAKNEKVWTAIKDKFTDQSISIPFSILKKLLLETFYELL